MTTDLPSPFPPGDPAGPNLAPNAAGGGRGSIEKSVQPPEKYFTIEVLFMVARRVAAQTLAGRSWGSIEQDINHVIEKHAKPEGDCP